MKKRRRYKRQDTGNKSKPRKSRSTICRNIKIITECAMKFHGAFTFKQKVFNIKIKYLTLKLKLIKILLGKSAPEQKINLAN